MDLLLPDRLKDVVLISLTLSIIIMPVIQSIKIFPFIKNTYYIKILNIVLAFVIGIPFVYSFYNVRFIDTIWVCLLSMLETPKFYDILKKQNILPLNLKSKDNNK